MSEYVIEYVKRKSGESINVEPGELVVAADWDDIGKWVVLTVLSPINQRPAIR